MTSYAECRVLAFRRTAAVSLELLHDSGKAGLDRVSAKGKAGLARVSAKRSC